MRVSLVRSSFFHSFLLVIAVAGVLRAQDFSGRTITAVEYEPVEQPIDARDLSNVQLLQVGEPLDLSQVAGTIDRLFATGLYDDIQVDAEPDGSTCVSVRFITRGRRFMFLPFLHDDAAGKMRLETEKHLEATGVETAPAHLDV